MNQNFILGLLWLLFGTTSLFGTHLDQANQQFKTGDYAGAVISYENILAAEGPRANVFYNLGNSYQQLKQYGPAILAYERARLLTPRDPDLLANLTLARKASASFEELGRYPQVDAVFHYFSLNEWSWLVVGASLVLGCLALLSGLVRLVKGGVRQFVGVFACCAGLVIVAGASALYLRRSEVSRGIILSQNAEVRLSPFEKAEVIGKLGPGCIVHLGKQIGDFYDLEVPGANLRGWMASRDVNAISP